jgi:hypothetical protein
LLKDPIEQGVASHAVWSILSYSIVLWSSSYALGVAAHRTTCVFPPLNVFFLPQRLPTRPPQMPLFEKFGIDPKPNSRVAGGGHFGKDHPGLVLTI